MLDYIKMTIFFFNDTATTEIYTLSLHDALPISRPARAARQDREQAALGRAHRQEVLGARSEEHTSELQSQFHLVCRLLLEKKKTWKRYCSRLFGVATLYVKSAEICARLYLHIAP